MDAKKRQALAVATNLVVANAQEIDLNRTLSFGKGGAKTFIDEERSAKTVTWTVSNALATEQFVIIGTPQNSIFADNAELKAAIDGTAVLADGVIATSGDDELTAVSNDAGRTISGVLRYAANTPLRFTAVALESRRLADGQADTSNFSGSIKTVWVSPFGKPEENTLPLRKFVSNRANSPQFSDINFIKEGFQVMASNEHFTIIGIKPGTELTMTFSVGAQFSMAQYTHRAAKKADSTLMPYRDQIKDCDC